MLSIFLPKPVQGGEAIGKEIFKLEVFIDRSFYSMQEVEYKGIYTGLYPLFEVSFLAIQIYCEEIWKKLDVTIHAHVGLEKNIKNVVKIKIKPKKFKRQFCHHLAILQQLMIQVEFHVLFFRE